MLGWVKSGLAAVGIVSAVAGGVRTVRRMRGGAGERRTGEPRVLFWAELTRCAMALWTLWRH
jgi:hypothetical protein